MSTRAAQAVTSRRAKQELVRLLFGKKYMKRGPEAHRKLDPSIYSFAELRKAYLDRLQTIHPDKLKHCQDNEAETTTTTSLSLNGQFVELQDAWDKYEQVAKIMRGNHPQEANFTKFGVGCSFSDSPDERAMRDKITDQACRGWFSAGSLADEEEESAMMDDNEVILPYSDDDPSNVSLCDDGLFEEQGEDDESSLAASLQHDDTIQSSRSSPPSLIPIGFRPKR